MLLVIKREDGANFYHEFYICGGKNCIIHTFFDLFY